MSGAASLVRARGARYGATGTPPPVIPGRPAASPQLLRWKQDRALASTQLVQVTINGDSTWAGETISVSPKPYSPFTRVRARLQAAGLTDGGHGVIGYADAPSKTLEPAGTGMVTSSTFNVNDAFPMPGSSAQESQTAGQTLTFRVNGSRIRVNYALFTTTGRFQYTIDGGAPITVDPDYSQAKGTLGFQWLWHVLADNGPHDITFTNIGGRLTQPPTTWQNPISSGSSGGSLPAGSYYYRYTRLLGGGAETGASVVIGTTVSGTSSQIILTLGSSNGYGYRIYRSATSGGVYSKLTDLAGSQSPQQYYDTGAVALDTSVHPPADGTTGLNNSQPRAQGSVDATKTAGIVLHNFAVSGTQSGFSNTALQDMMGLVQSTTALSAVDTSPGARTPSIAFHGLGTNDQQGNGGTDTSSLLYTHAVSWANAAQQAGADTVICQPAFEAAGQPQLAPQYKAALAQAAGDTNSLLIDLGVGGALGPQSGWSAKGYGGANGNPHLTATAYDAQGDWIADRTILLDL